MISHSFSKFAAIFKKWRQKFHPHVSDVNKSLFSYLTLNDDKTTHKTSSDLIYNPTV